MEELKYSIQINAPKSLVWNSMLETDKYEQWVKAFSENSTFEGTWEEGAIVRFIDPGLGGTKAILEKFKPYDCIIAKHVAMLSKDGSEDTKSESAKQWIGTIEKYIFSENNNLTTLTIEMQTNSAFTEMFDTCWPKALSNIKTIAEKV